MFAKTISRARTLSAVLKERHAFARFLETLARDPLERHRISGTWATADVARYTALATAVAGDFAEIGCYKGDTFSQLIPLAAAQGKRAHAFDSFEGMDAPGELDWRPKGQFDVGGVAGFRSLMQQRGFAADRYDAWPGFIPGSFDAVPADLRFSFVLLDVDNHDPTRDALKWVWPRLNEGGVLALDDFYPAHDGEASWAIKSFLRRHDDFHVFDLVNNQLVLLKRSRHD